MANSNTVVDLDQSMGDNELSRAISQLTKVVTMQAKQLNSLVKLVEGQTMAANGDSKSELIQRLSNRIPVFSYDPTGDTSFDAWYALNADIFEDEAKSLSDSSRARLLRHRLDPVAHERFVHYILPDNPKEIGFKETVEILRKLFRKQESDFCLRWKCFQMARKETEDFSAYTARVNKTCEDFKLKELSVDQFKCLIFILGLKSPREADIRSKLHNKLDTAEDPTKVTINALAEEAGRILKLKHDTKLGSVGECVAVRAVASGKKGKFFGKKPAAASSPAAPKYPCWRCGAMHFSRECSFTSHTCARCNKQGHKEGYCNVGKRNEGAKAKVQIVRIPGESNSRRDNNNVTTVEPGPSDQSAVRVNKVSHRKFIDVKVNQKLVRFQLDTAADVSIITKEDWEVLGCPTLKPPPFIPVTDANVAMPILGFLDVVLEIKGKSVTVSVA